MNETRDKLVEALWRIYRRPEQPQPWVGGGNLPWDEPEFSRRMLREHLDESHGAASRTGSERLLQLDWLWSRLGLQPGARVLDITCGPGLYSVELAGRGCRVTGVDFSPASLKYARELAARAGVADRCTFIEQDVRRMDFRGADFDAALFLYGQLAVFTKAEARSLLEQIALSLRPGGALVVELLDQDKVDKSPGTWWFTDDKGLWGDHPFLHLGERFWLEEESLSIERFYTLHLESGEVQEILLNDQSYAVGEMGKMMAAAGLVLEAVYPSWNGLPLYDAGEWLVYLAKTTVS